MVQSFISPAVVSPDTIDIEIPKENNMVLSRGLMLIAKIVQSLANNQFFAREPYMTFLNKLLESNIENISEFLTKTHVCNSLFCAINTFLLKRN
jgi:hypothetical protein